MVLRKGMAFAILLRMNTVPDVPVAQDSEETVNITLSGVPGALHQAARARAKAEGRTVSGVLRILLTRWLDGSIALEGPHADAH